MTVTSHPITPTRHRAAQTRHLTTRVNGLDVFYREAGDPAAPTVVLLHGAPTSSFMFRDLIPRLAGDYHVVAPDLIGFGLSAAPAVADFDYTFDHLTDVVDAFLDQAGIGHFALLVQDYGAPVGWRLALRHPERITGIISQNGNAYEEGFVDSFWAPLWRYAEDRTRENAAPLLGALTLESIHWQYTHGVPDPTVVSPDAWLHDHAQVSRPGNNAVQLALFADYPTNVALYPDVHAYFRSSRVPLLAVWGGNDEIFGPDGARAFAGDLPDAEIHLLDGGHFLLESHLDEAAGLIRDFLARTVSAPRAAGPGGAAS
jgi:pimeloyl-ACP methyl ester carboxylesterase